MSIHRVVIKIETDDKYCGGCHMLERFYMDRSYCWAFGVSHLCFEEGINEFVRCKTCIDAEILNPSKSRGLTEATND